MAANPSAPPKGLRIAACSHSFHSFCYRLMGETAKAAGITDQVGVAVSGIGGAPMTRHWDVPEQNNVIKDALRNSRVDVLLIGPVWLPDEAIEKFAALGFEHNPNFQIVIQKWWLPNDRYDPRYPLDNRKSLDHDEVDFAVLQSEQDAYDADMDAEANAINKKLGKRVAVTVPVGQAAIALRKLIVAGKVPGLKKQWDLFRDPWGHPHIPLQFLGVYCHYGVVYGRSPVGLPELDTWKKENRPEWDAALNRVLQEVAWDAVQQHPMNEKAEGLKRPAVVNPTPAPKGPQVDPFL